MRSSDWSSDVCSSDLPEALGAIIARNPQVERVLSGHFHRPIQVRWSGTIAATAPSTAHQFALTLQTNAPRGWVMEPPGYLLHEIGRASCRERVCQYVYIPLFAVS